MKFHTDNLILLILSIFVSSLTFLSNPQQASATYWCKTCNGTESQEEIRRIENESREYARTHDILGRPYSSSQSGDSGDNFFIILVLILSPIGIYMYLRSRINKDE
jgi:hypothetical protein